MIGDIDIRFAFLVSSSPDLARRRAYFILNLCLRSIGLGSVLSFRGPRPANQRFEATAAVGESRRGLEETCDVGNVWCDRDRVRHGVSARRAKLIKGSSMSCPAPAFSFFDHTPRSF